MCNISIRDCLLENLSAVFVLIGYSSSAFLSSYSKDQYLNDQYSLLYLLPIGSSTGNGYMYSIVSYSVYVLYCMHWRPLFCVCRYTLKCQKSALISAQLSVSKATALIRMEV